MRTYKITGGPDPTKITILDPDGKDITSDIRAVVIRADAHHLATVELTSFVEYDLRADRRYREPASDVDPRPL